MTTSVQTRDVQVRSPEGLHLRPASAIGKFVMGRRIAVEVIHQDLVVDASSVLDLLTLAATQGTVLTLRATGEGADGVLEQLVQFFDSGFEVNRLAVTSVAPSPDGRASETNHDP